MANSETEAGAAAEGLPDALAATRLRRFEVESTNVPLAEIKSAGVIMAANTSVAAPNSAMALA